MSDKWTQVAEEAIKVLNLVCDRLQEPTDLEKAEFIMKDRLNRRYKEVKKKVEEEKPKECEHEWGGLIGKDSFS
jgi:hypothetical protein